MDTGESFFHINVPSTPSHLCPSNTTSDFKLQLPEYEHLPGDWQISILEGWFPPVDMEKVKKSYEAAVAEKKAAAIAKQQQQQQQQQQQSTPTAPAPAPAAPAAAPAAAA